MELAIPSVFLLHLHIMSNSAPAPAIKITTTPTGTTVAKEWITVSQVNCNNYHFKCACVSDESGKFVRQHYRLDVKSSYSMTFVMYLLWPRPRINALCQRNYGTRPSMHQINHLHLTCGSNEEGESLWNN